MKRCSGKISECEHGHAGMNTSFGEMRPLFGDGPVIKNYDPSWQCTCCGFPMFPVAERQDGDYR